MSKKEATSIVMKRGSTWFLRAAIGALGIGVLALCIFALPPAWQAVPDEYPDITYVFYGILTAMYVAAVPFFIALYQALLLLNYIDKNTVFSELSARALKRVTYCAVAISAVYVAILPLLYVWVQKDDAPGLMVIGMIISGTSLAVGIFAAVLRRLVQEAVNIKSENDLTV